jgi:hypothetical protein
LSTKIEIKLKKSRASRWQSLENTGGNVVTAWDAKLEPTGVPAAKLYPSSKGAKNWDKIGAGEEEDKLEGDAALNKVRASSATMTTAVKPSKKSELTNHLILFR